MLDTDVALRFSTPKVSQNHLSCFDAVWHKMCLCAVKPNEKQHSYDLSCHFIPPPKQKSQWKHNIPYFLEYIFLIKYDKQDQQGKAAFNERKRLLYAL
jgi:hypothetical protein